MFGRLLCWLGFHDEYWQTGGHIGKGHSHCKRRWCSKASPYGRHKRRGWPSILGQALIEKAAREKRAQRARSLYGHENLEPENKVERFAKAPQGEPK